MKRLIKYFFVALLAMAFYATGFVVPWDLGPNGTVSVVKANHRNNGGQSGGDNGGDNGGSNGNCRNRNCGPPTVSELPIQYMVLSGAAMIALSGGMVFYIRKRKMRSSLEA